MSELEELRKVEETGLEELWRVEVSERRSSRGKRCSGYICPRRKRRTSIESSRGKWPPGIQNLVGVRNSVSFINAERKKSQEGVKESSHIENGRQKKRSENLGR